MSAQVIVVGGQKYLLTEDGVAHPIAATSKVSESVAKVKADDRPWYERKDSKCKRCKRAFTAGGLKSHNALRGSANCASWKHAS